MDLEFVCGKEKLRKNYKFGEKIGQPGQFGYARKCVNKKDDRELAAKVINKNKFKSVSQKKVFFGQLRNEIEIMKELHHANVIQYFDFFEDEINLYIIMELCQGGELFDRIAARGSYSEKDAAGILRQIVEGLSYLHKKKIAHLDLKPDNFLFLTNDENSVIKIIDFGMARLVEKNKYFSRLVGTPYYIAPEVLKGQYRESCDIWSVGIILFVMLFGYPPFYADPNSKNCDALIFSEIKKGFKPVTKDNYGPWFPRKIECSDSAKDLIAKLLEYDSARRLTAEEALEHPWLKGETANEKQIDKFVLERIMYFRKNYKLKEAFLKYVTSNLEESEMEELRDEFRKIDLDKNGMISVKELEVVLKRVCSHVEEDRASRIIEEVDANKDGYISYEEWCMVAINKRLVDKEERLKSLFEKFDENKDGKLSVDEIKSTLTNVDDSMDVELAIAEADKDGDGFVDYDEFVQMFENR